MTTPEVEIVIQRARELYPPAHPRIISDNGPPSVARDFKELIRTRSMTHVRTSPYYPQSNGRIERWRQTLRVTTIRPHRPPSVEAARVLVAAFVTYYNHQRLHSASGFVTPADALGGRRTPSTASNASTISRGGIPHSATQSHRLRTAAVNSLTLRPRVPVRLMLSTRRAGERIVEGRGQTERRVSRPAHRHRRSSWVEAVRQRDAEGAHDRDIRGRAEARRSRRHQPS
ncbi:MAG: transposase [Gemmatimonadaceae bacterium]|nr:transposase [Gemmatimonadaceae bacterium]